MRCHEQLHAHLLSSLTTSPVFVLFSVLLCQQQDIARGRGMVDELFQGWGGTGGTANAVLSSTEYLSQAAKTFNNIEDGFYISPAFLDKITIHIAKNFMDLPKIKVPLILGIWGGKGQVRRREEPMGWLALSTSF
jgi:hypothetical protein